MIRKGTRIQVIGLGWDPQAVDEAIGRKLKYGETGVVVEGKRNDPHFVESDMRKAEAHDPFVVEFDRGGRAVLCRDEMKREDS
jgi:hypothetical protein